MRKCTLNTLWTVDTIIGPCCEKTCLCVFLTKRVSKTRSPQLQRLAKKNEILPAASLHMILSKKRTTKALIRIHAGLSVPVLFPNPGRQVFSGRGPNELHIFSQLRISVEIWIQDVDERQC